MLIECNIVGRVLSSMETLIRCLSNCFYPDPPNTIDQSTANGINILNQCLVIMSNLSADSPI